MATGVSSHLTADRTQHDATGIIEVNTEGIPKEICKEIHTG